MSQFVREVSGVNIQPIGIFCDNTSSIKLAKNDAYHERTKHINVRYHHVREKLEEKQICIEHISTDDMIADALTKSLNGPKTKKFAMCMGLH